VILLLFFLAILAWAAWKSYVVVRAWQAEDLELMEQANLEEMGD